MSILPVLNYHGIEASPNEYAWKDVERPYVLNVHSFREQMEHIAETGFKALDTEGMRHWFSDGKTAYAPPDDLQLVLTFDDGHMSHFEYAANILEMRKLKAIFFISAGLVGTPGMMQWYHLKELVKKGFEIGSHGFYHQPLTKLREHDLEREIVRSKILLENRLDIQVRSFSVPRGFYHPRIKALLKRSGYEFVFTSSFDVNLRGIKTSPVYLKRLAITNRVGMEEYKCYLSGDLGIKKFIEAVKEFVRRFIPPSIYDWLARWRQKQYA